MVFSRFYFDTPANARKYNLSVPAAQSKYEDAISQRSALTSTKITSPIIITQTTRTCILTVVVLVSFPSSRQLRRPLKTHHRQWRPRHHRHRRSETNACPCGQEGYESEEGDQCKDGQVRTFSLSHFPTFQSLSAIHPKLHQLSVFYATLFLPTVLLHLHCFHTAVLTSSLARADRSAGTSPYPASSWIA